MLNERIIAEALSEGRLQGCPDDIQFRISSEWGSFPAVIPPNLRGGRIESPHLSSGAKALLICGHLRHG